MSRFLRILDGRVYDPVQGLDGVVREICVDVTQGTIITSIPDNTQTNHIDTIPAHGYVVMPGGVEMHTHIATPLPIIPQPTMSPASLQHPAWGLPADAQAAARGYTALGYTAAIEAAVLPAQTQQTREALEAISNLDMGLLLELGNNEDLLRLLDKGDHDAAQRMMAHLLRIHGAYGMKFVNPGSSVFHNGRVASYREPHSIDSMIPGTRVPTRRLFEVARDLSRQIALPAPLYLHTSRLGLPGNIDSTLRTLDALAGHRVHLAHAQFYSYSQSQTRGGYASAAAEFCEYLAHHQNITSDVGPVIFGPAWTMTADEPLKQRLRQLIGRRLELGDPCSVPPPSEGQSTSASLHPSHERLLLYYRTTSEVHSLQWAVGLEIILLCENLWQLGLSVDHPNGGSFLAYPSVIGWLMSRARRADCLSQLPPHTSDHTVLGHIDRELTLYEIAILTRAAPARILGLKRKGHLQPGADADVAIYPDITDDPSFMFSHPAWVIKSGRVVLDHGQPTDSVASQWLRPDSFVTD